MVSLQNRLDFIRSQVHGAQADGVVLGLSGGKDSACVAALCVAAGVKVYGVQLPIFSSSDDKDYVRLLCERFPEIEMIEWDNHRIESYNRSLNMLEVAFDVLSSFSSVGLPPLEEEATLQRSDKIRMSRANIKPRLRMIALYALAQSRNCLVAGTGNASEAYVGYFTKWGDGAHDFNPIGDLLKDEVIELGISLGVPEKLMKRPPSAGLWAGQTDEDEMGFTYKDIEETIKGNGEKIDTKSYLNILKMHTRTEHKRKAIPVPTSTERGI